MTVNNPKNDGEKDWCLIDFNLLERMLHKQGEFGLVSIDTVLEILKKMKKNPSSVNI